MAVAVARWLRPERWHGLQRAVARAAATLGRLWRLERLRRLEWRRRWCRIGR